MGTDNRDYMSGRGKGGYEYGSGGYNRGNRGGYNGGNGGGGDMGFHMGGITCTKMVKLIIIANIVVFLAQYASDGVQLALHLDVSNVMRGQVWRLLTCAFCHDTGKLFHILFNLLMLFWFGRELEKKYGSREFLYFYVFAALVASLAFVGLKLATNTSGNMIGASGAVMGVMMLYALWYPRQKIYLFLVIPVEIRWVVLAYVVMESLPILGALSGNPSTDGIAHAAHLGGLAFGFLYVKFGLRLEKHIGTLGFIHNDNEKKLRAEEKAAGPKTGEVDAILDKVASSGIHSLTAKEKKILDAASRKKRQS